MLATAEGSLRSCFLLLTAAEGPLRGRLLLLAAAEGPLWSCLLLLTTPEGPLREHLVFDYHVFVALHLNLPPYIVFVCAFWLLFMLYSNRMYKLNVPAVYSLKLLKSISLMRAE